MKKMPPYSLLLALSIFSCLYFSCQKSGDLCPKIVDLGTHSWSKETESWIPASYFNISQTITYVAEDGEEKTFEITSISPWGYPVGPFAEIPCEDGAGVTKYTYDPKRYQIRSMSSDSVMIIYALFISNKAGESEPPTVLDLFEGIGVHVLAVRKSRAFYYGHLSIITDPRNAELENLPSYRKNHVFNPSLEINGYTFEETYSSLEPKNPPADIFFKKGKGVVAFRDDGGKLWRLKD